MFDHLPDWSSFCGHPAAQHWADYELWEQVLNEHRVGGIVEIGTGKGGFALYLWTQARARGIGFVTIDQHPAPLHLPQIVCDVFQKETVRACVLAARPCLLFCDGGDKPAEVAEFSPLLQVGDLLAVHDYNHEIFEADIPERFEPVAGDGLTRFYKATGDA